MGHRLTGQSLRLIPVTVQILLRRLQQVEKNARLPVYLSQLVVQILDLQKGLHLPCDAAHVLPAQNVPRIGTVLQVALMEPAHDAAGVVPHVLVAHGSRIGAVIDLSLRIACNASGVRMDGYPVQALLLLQLIHGEILDSVCHLHAVGVDAAGIGAVVQRPLVAAADSARAVIPGHDDGAAAAPDLAGACVYSRKAPHPVSSRHGAGHIAVYDFPVIDPGQNPCLTGAASGLHSAGNVQVTHHAPGLHIAKQTHGGSCPGDLQTGDRMSPAVKDPPEAGNHQASLLKRNVLFQLHVLVPGP